MKAHNHIDDMFQQHFAETDVPMDNQEALWQRISGKKDDRRRGFLWVSLLGLACCLAAGFTLYNSNQSSDQKSVSTNITTTIDYTPNNNSINNQIVTIDLNEDQSTDEKQFIKSKVTNNSRQVISNSSIGAVKSEIIITNNISLAVTPKEVLIENQPTISVLNKNVLIESSAVSEIAKPQLNNYKFINSELESNPLYNSIPPIYSQSDSWSKCEVKTPGHFFVDAYGQAGLSMDQIDLSQAGSDQAAYRNLWNERFDPKASWHGGVQVGYELKNGLRLSVGAEYQELVTEYSDNQRITEIIRVWDPQAFFEIDMNGDRVWVGDTVTAINIYDRKFVRKNTHTLLHIPFQVSYDIYKKPGFHIAVDASAALNLSKTYEGQFIRSDRSLIMIDENNQDNYISKDIGVSFSAGLHFGKYFNDNWEVYASPRFRYNPNSYLVNTETLKITRNMIGLRGGLRYHF